MQTIVIYRSILGTSERYAKWLSKELRTECLNYKKVFPEQLEKYETIILVGPTYMSKVLLDNYIEANWNILKKKKVVFVNIGIFSFDIPNKSETWKEIHKKIIKIKIPVMMGAVNQKGINKRNLSKLIKAIEK